MKRIALLALVLAFCALSFAPTGALAVDTNVALGKSVTATGPYNGDLTTLVDGIFRPQWTTWYDGTVYWSGTGVTINVDLGSTFTIRSFVVQADDNDAYTLFYRDLTDNSFKVAWNVPNYDVYGGVNFTGMQTRPDPYHDTQRYILASPIVTDALQFVAASGDNSYAVSEIQAYGSAVPLPASMLLFAPGLAGLAAIKRRFKK